MRRKLMVVLLIICASLSVSACTQAETDFEVYFESVFELTCTSESRFESVGTAFKLDSGAIVTNAHIVSYKEYGEYTTYEEITIKRYMTSETISLKVKTIDNEKDVAILEPIDANNSFNKILGLKMGQTSDLVIGDSLYAIGNLNDYGLSCNKGILSAKEKQIENNGNLNSYLQTDIEISKGSSGGPVLNRKGEVMGIMTFKLRDTNHEYVDGISFFIPTKTVKNLL